MLQRIVQSLLKWVLSMSSTFSSPKKRMPFIDLDLPLAALVSIAKKMKILTCTQEIYKSKA
jgi:hypothetical protein